MISEPSFEKKNTKKVSLSLSLLLYHFEYIRSDLIVEVYNTTILLLQNKAQKELSSQMALERHRGFVLHNIAVENNKVI